jgi:SagB-type dehydrogenase family enzyme
VRAVLNPFSRLRKRLGVLVSLGLLAALVLTFLTGFIASALDLNRFTYHKYLAYFAVALAAVHVVLHWRSLVGQVRRWLLQSSPPPRATAAPARESQVTRRAFLQPAMLLGAGLVLGGWVSRRVGAPPLEAGEDLGQVYHKWSTPSYAGLLVKSLHVKPQPPLYKTYPNAAVVDLPLPPPPEGIPLEVAIAQRRSVRDYAARPLALDEVSRLLYYTNGITDRRDPTLAFRAAPSSGALFPVEIYPVIFNVAGVAPGVYHYHAERHQLQLVRAGDFRREVFEAAVSQEMVLHSSLVLVLAGMFSRVHFKYVDRSYRYILLEAGHLGQNVYLAATALGLGPCGIGAFFDDALDRLLALDGHDETTVYLLAIGPRAT